MRRSNFALRLQTSLLEELRKAAEVEGVALNQLINVAVAEKISALRTAEYFQERGRRADRAETLRILERAGQGPPLWKATNFPLSGERSQAGKRRMREIRPSGDRRRGPLLNSGAALRLSEPSPSRLASMGPNHLRGSLFTIDRPRLSGFCAKTRGTRTVQPKPVPLGF